jgi:hypothetical protein
VGLRTKRKLKDCRARSTITHLPEARVGVHLLGDAVVYRTVSNPRFLQTVLPGHLLSIRGIRS